MKSGVKSGARTGVLISGYFGCGNLGDDLLLSATIAQLRVLTPGAQFLVRDSGYVARLPVFAPDVEFTGIDAILADRSRSRLDRLVRFVAGVIKLLRRCNWFIFAGGTVFHEQNGAHSLMLQWLICRLSRLIGVRIAALGVGVSDLHSRRGRWLMHDIVAMSGLFLVRDEAARRQCGSGKVRVTEDLVFGWEEFARTRQARTLPGEGGSRTIALTVCPPAFRGDAAERAVAAFAEAIRVWQLAGHRVVFLVFYAPPDIAGDETMFEQIVERLGPGAQVETRILPAVPQALAVTYRDIDTICGMRFHGFVLAAMFGVPFVGVAHDSKISEICRRFDMACLDAGTFDGAALVRAAASIVKRRPDPIQVERCMAASRENFRALAEFIE
jgi:polysaccharide pyruvyl transferase WcaK-like protein